MNIREILNKLTEEKNTLAKEFNELRNKNLRLLERSDVSADDFKESQETQRSMDKLTEKMNDIDEKRTAYEKALRGNEIPVADVPNEARKQAPQKKGYRSAVEEYIRSKGTKVSSELRFTEKEVVVPESALQRRSDNDTGMETSVTSETMEPTIPVAQSYRPIREPFDTTDMKQFTGVIPVNTSRGKQPILKNANSRLNSTPELKKNKSLAEPEMSNVTWEVETYRGAIPIAQETIDDSAIDVMGIIAENANQLKLNTTNYAISLKLKEFEQKTVSSLDELKEINNVDLSVAYKRQLVASQSFYNVLDKIKDNDGRYMLQTDITSPTGKAFSGIPITVVEDELLGEQGEANAFIGDTKRAILFADRKDLTVRWIDSTVYGQYLQVAVRFGVEVADKKAGFFLTWGSSKQANNSKSAEPAATTK